MRRKEYLPIGKNPEYAIYHNEYDRLRVDSNILNSGNRVPNAHSILWNKENIESELYRFFGDENGNFKRSGVYHAAAIPLIEGKLKAIDKNFKRFQQERVNSGYEKPETMPEDLKQEQLKLFARLDVFNEEAEFLEQQLKKYLEKEKTTDDSMVLAYGLRCAGHLHGTRAKNRSLVNTLKDIDGQTVELVDEVLVITDIRSPYRGLRVIDYRKLADIWQKERKEAARMRLLKLQEEARKEGLTIPSQLPASSIKKVNKASLPKFPSWAKNYLKNGTDENAKNS